MQVQAKGKAEIIKGEKKLTVLVSKAVTEPLISVPQMVRETGLVVVMDSKEAKFVRGQVRIDDADI